MSLSADAVISALGLEPHPEGGHFRETFRDAAAAEGGALSTAIYYLLRAGERSHWHRVDAAEVWHFYSGAPLTLSIAAAGGPMETIRLGTDFAAGDRPQAVVPAGAWQSAERAPASGGWSAARWRRAFASKASSLRRTAGRQVRRRPDLPLWKPAQVFAATCPSRRSRPRR
jgi:predicted cupin superfamily sugar epimerase